MLYIFDYSNLIKAIFDKGFSSKDVAEILEIPDHGIQRVTIEATEGNSMVESVNSGGARLILKAAQPSVEKAREIAKELNIVIID